MLLEIHVPIVALEVELPSIQPLIEPLLLNEAFPLIHAPIVAFEVILPKSLEPKEEFIAVK
jgi:hypothetical protein